jgi:hypothetical protein
MNSVAQYIARHCSSSSFGAGFAAGLEAFFGLILQQIGDIATFRAGLEMG